jgi:hypothetical protein
VSIFRPNLLADLVRLECVVFASVNMSRLKTLMGFGSDM